MALRVVRSKSFEYAHFAPEVQSADETVDITDGRPSSPKLFATQIGLLANQHTNNAHRPLWPERAERRFAKAPVLNQVAGIMTS